MLSTGTQCLQREGSEITSAEGWLVFIATQVHPLAVIPWKQRHWKRPVVH